MRMVKLRFESCSTLILCWNSEKNPCKCTRGRHQHHMELMYVRLCVCVWDRERERKIVFVSAGRTENENGEKHKMPASIFWQIVSFSLSSSYPFVSRHVWCPDNYMSWLDTEECVCYCLAAVLLEELANHAKKMV